ncbi:MAG: ATP-binding protein [Myxococcota bacterium]|nr:ATP-binding protein [Myxococcota bacterium]
MSRPLVCLCALLLSWGARADLPRQFSSAQGLPQRTVLDMAQDGNGFLWVATLEGIARFDGRTFKVVGSGQQLPCPAVNAIKVAPSGEVFAGLRDCGVVRIDRSGVLHPERVDGVQGSEQVHALALHQQTLFVGTAAGLYRRTAQGYRPVSELAGVEVEVLLTTPGGLLAGTSKGLYRVEGTGARRVVEAPLSGLRITALEADGQGGLWVGTSGPLYHLDAAFSVLATAASPLPVWDPSALTRLPSGELWVGTEQGIWTLGPDGVLQPLDAATFPRQWITSFQRCASGLWIGTVEQGLYQLRDGGGRLIAESAGLVHPVSWALHEDPDGGVWVTTGDGALYRIDQEGKVQLQATAPSRLRLNSLTRTTDGSLWVGGQGGLFRVTAGGLERSLHPQAQEPVRNVVAHEDGGLWFTTGQAVHLLGASGVRTWPAAALKTGRLIQALSDGRRGLYVTSGTGLLHLRADGSFQLITPPPELGMATSVLIRKGRVWVGSAMGLGLLEGDRLRRVYSKTRRLNRTLLSLVEDEHGAMWTGTNHGVFSITSESLDRAAVDPQAELDVTYLNEVNGAVPLECNAVSGDGAIRARDGRLWFVTMEGVLVVDPLRVRGTRALQAPLIEEVTTASGRTGVGRGLALELPAGTPWWRVDFNLPLMVGAERLQFRYRLHAASSKPNGDDWTEAQQLRSALFTRTPPGDYVFELQARLPPGEWSPTATLQTRLQPYWYQRSWVRALIAGLVVTLVVLLVWRQFKQIQTHARWLELRVKERTSELAIALERSTASELNLRSLAEALPVGIVLCQREELIWANAEAHRIAGTAVEKTRPVWAAPAAELQPVWRELALGGGALPREGAVEGKDGVMRTVELQTLPIDFDGAPATALVAVDTTERRELDRRLQMSARLASMGTLAAGVAHELNNPLAFVLANVVYLQEELQRLYPGGAPEELDAVVAETLQGAGRLKRIVADMKAFSRDDVTESAAVVDLRSVVEFSLRLAEREIAPRARVVTYFQPDLPPVYGSEARLGQVLINLLVNAAQAIPAGDPAGNQVTVRTARSEPGWISVTVTDTGPGILPEHLPRLFDPFFTTKPVGTGTGLGLSVSHGIIKTLGGELRVHSSPGAGATFTVMLREAEGGQANPELQRAG